MSSCGRRRCRGQPGLVELDLLTLRQQVRTGGLGEVDDGIEPRPGFLRVQAHQRTAQGDVVAAGVFGVEASAQLQQGTNASSAPEGATAGLHNPGNDLEQGRFSGAVDPHQCRGGPGFDLQVDAVQGTESVGSGGLAPQLVPQQAKLTPQVVAGGIDLADLPQVDQRLQGLGRVHNASSK